MMKMKGQDKQTDNIDYRINRDLKKITCHFVKILMITFYQAQFHKIKIHEMKNEKDEYYYTGIDHIFGEKGSLRRVCYSVSGRSCQPILNLKNDSPNNMDKKSAIKTISNTFIIGFDAIKWAALLKGTGSSDRRKRLIPRWTKRKIIRNRPTRAITNFFVSDEPKTLLMGLFFTDVYYLSIIRKCPLPNAFKCIFL